MGHNEDLLDELEEFTYAIYGRARVHKVNELRYIRIQELCAKEDQPHPSKNVDLGSLPPCRRSLEQHVRRVNYQVGIWKRAHIAEPDIPDVKVDHGWEVKDGKLEPLWYTGDVLPQDLIDIAGEPLQSDDDVDSDDSETVYQPTDVLDQFTVQSSGESTDSDLD